MSDYVAIKTMLPGGVRFIKDSYTDEYFGTAEALIDAGVVRVDQLPGGEGMPATSATFYDGKQVKRRVKSPRDEKYLRIEKMGKKFMVTRYLSESEGNSRREARRAPEVEVGRGFVEAAFALTRFIDALGCAKQRAIAVDLFAGILRKYDTRELPKPNARREVAYLQLVKS